MRTTASMSVLSFLVIAGCDAIGGGASEPPSAEPPPDEAPAPTVEEPAPAPEPEPDPPAVVAEAYLRAGSAQDAARVRELIEPRCHGDEALTRVDAIRMMGVPLELTSLEVTAEVDGERATARFEASGSARGEGGETKLGGLRIRAGNVNIEGATKSGALALARVDGRWRITCD